jgi:hypothetical protein
MKNQPKKTTVRPTSLDIPSLGLRITKEGRAMHHKVEPLEIMTTTDGSIDLIHVDGFSDDEAPVVHIPVHQVDLVI